MAKEEHYYTKFEQGKFYHVYNRTVDQKPMFKNAGNYYFFLQRFFDYLDDFLEVYAYALLGNHFHLLVKVREEFLVPNLANPATTDIHLIISKQFRCFFQSYALAFNKQQQRIGTLFLTPFKRALITDNAHLIYMVLYIHLNSEKHNLVTISSTGNGAPTISYYKIDRVKSIKQP
jgi:putative transposase